MPGQTATEAISARLRTLAGGVREGGATGLANRLGLEPANVRRYVRGQVAAPHDFLVAVADSYGVSLDWLYGRDSSRPPPDPEMPAWARRLESRLEFLEHHGATGAAVDAIITRGEVLQLVADVEGRVTGEIQANRATLIDALAGDFVDAAMQKLAESPDGARLLGIEDPSPEEEEPMQEPTVSAARSE